VSGPLRLQPELYAQRAWGGVTVSDSLIGPIVYCTLSLFIYSISVQYSTDCEYSVGHTSRPCLEFIFGGALFYCCPTSAPCFGVLSSSPWGSSPILRARNERKDVPGRRLFASTLNTFSWSSSWQLTFVVLFLAATV